MINLSVNERFFIKEKLGNHEIENKNHAFQICKLFLYDEDTFSSIGIICKTWLENETQE